jgi:alkylation response protein AidB-like acyl-CoA dehydrogenase
VIEGVMAMTMTETNHTGPVTAVDVRGAVDALLPTIAARAGEIEEARRLPPDLLDDLRATGCFRYQLPASHGGFGASLGDAVALVEAISRADASTGWSVMIAAGMFRELAELPRATFDEIFTDPNTTVAGVFRPSGVVTPIAGAYEVSGRWAFASGCVYADWIYGNAIEPSQGDPTLRAAVFERGQVELEDTWHVLGMRGTASHHFSVDRAIVAAERTFVPLSGEACVDTPYAHIPPPSMFALEIAGVALGTARAGLDDVLAMSDMVPMLDHGSLATNPHFHLRLSQADTALRAGRALVGEHAEELWELARLGSTPSGDVVARTRAAAAWSTAIAVDAGTTAYRLGGGSAVHDDNTLQRRLRDLNTIAQHFLVKPDTLTTAGGVLAGQPPPVPIF